MTNAAANIGNRTILTRPPCPIKRRRAPLRFVDMFCGIGGFHAALSSLDMECVFACDIDEHARQTYHSNFGMTPAQDITDIKASNIPDHDILCAGFPCQPFSIIGNREGFNDIRGTLFFDIARILRAKRPPAFILENVRQLATHGQGKTIAKIITTLKKVGYSVDYKILDARNFGLPQKRERVLIVGMLNGLSGFEWPGKKIPMKPLSKILETDKKQLAGFYVSDHIKEKRKAQHRAEISPAIWHENKGGNIASHPFSCALRAGASYNYLLVDGKRRLTPREMLRLQGFSDKFKIVCTYQQIRKQAGNAVPVPLIKAVAENLKHALTTKNKNKQTYS